MKKGDFMWTYLIQFIILFVVAYLCYVAMGFISDKTNKNKKEIKKQMAEVALFVKLYNINLKKVSYKKISNVNIKNNKDIIRNMLAIGSKFFSVKILYTFVHMFSYNDTINFDEMYSN